MSHVLYWPGRTFFYPLGNTSAVRLTENLPPENNADVLLLGCGDARHILYTVYADATRSAAGPRKIDVTCCDMEAAVLARNALLFTLLSDDGAENRLSSIWNIFYHMMLDKDSLSLLIEQCRKLVPLAQDMQTWKLGPYAHIVTMCDNATLFDIQRFWKLWLGTADFNVQQTKRFTENFQDGLKGVRARNKDCFIMTSMRSAGPLAPVTLIAATDQFESFWTSGVTDDGIQAAKPAINVNPTFAFSASGDKFAVHYATDPILGFHLAETLASSGCALSDDESAAIVFKMVQAARHQFNAWCKAVIRRTQHKSASSAPFVVRMYAGEALAFCQALHAIGIGLQPHTPSFVVPWKRSVVQLDKTAYGSHASSPAPTSFNVIETSNLLDHLGLHNLLIVTVPLLRNSPSSTLYTEALLTLGESAAKGILTRMCGDPSTISLLLGVIPSGYVSRFTTRSNMSETFMHDILNGPKAQHHERLAWKPVGPEWHGTAELSRKKSIRFAPEQLAKTLFGIYLQMFSDENISKRLDMTHLPEGEMFLNKIQSSGLLHYTRRSFALFLAHIQERVWCDWDKVINILEGLVLGDQTLITGSNFYQELVCQLHLAGFILPWLSPTNMQELRAQEDPPIFRDWSMVPQVVTVALVVPRHFITKLQSELAGVRTTILQCEIRVAFGHDAFACTSASFGELEISGRGENKTAVFMEDSAGAHGTSPVVLSFPVLATTLIRASGGTVGLAVPSTMSSILGMEMSLFKAPLTDERYVHVLAKAPTTSNAATDAATPPAPLERSDDAIEHHPIHVEMDASNTQVLSLTAHVNITDAEEQGPFVRGCAVRTTQLSANQAILYVEKYQHTVSFPLPVDALLNAKVRVARKSKYVEIVAPMSFTLDVKGERDITKNFRITIDTGIPILWDVHYLNLDRCPSFKLSKDPKAFNWFVPHVSYMFSHRERVARNNRKVVPGVAHDTLLNVKDSLRTFFCAATGLGTSQTHAEFALWNRNTEDIYTIILVTDLRLDLASHTIVADSWVIPGSNDIRVRLIGKLSTALSIQTDANESEAWRHLLPLFIERCRTWEHKSNCEYLAQNSAPLYPGVGGDPNKVPYCLCGMGVGTEVLRRRYGDGAVKYATRAAISPLFFVPYLERAGTTDGSVPSAKAPSQVGCRACGKEGKALSVCSRCKKVKYCSRECQVKDWKRHKKDCTQASPL